MLPSPPVPSGCEQTTLPDGRTIACVDAHDAHNLYEQIFHRDVYRNKGVEFADGQCVVDVGANIGMFLLFTAAQCRNLRYVGCEPIPKIFAALEENARRTPGVAATVLNVGIGRQEGTATFQFLPKAPCCSSMHVDSTEDDRQRACRFTLHMMEENAGRVGGAVLRSLPTVARNWLAGRVMARYGQAVPVECQLKTLSQVIDSLELEQIDVLKIDAERAEVDILAGLEQRHWDRIRQMIVEVHWKDGPQYDAVYGMLAGHGFRLHVDRNPFFDETPVIFAAR